MDGPLVFSWKTPGKRQCRFRPFVQTNAGGRRLPSERNTNRTNNRIYFVVFRDYAFNGVYCFRHTNTEMAMLLPASFGASRRMNDSHDIRKNLRFRNAELAQEHPEGANNE